MVYNCGAHVMKKYLLLLSAFAMTFFCGCSKWAGDPITETFSVDGTYTELVVEDAFDVTVSDEVSRVTVTAGDNIMPKVRVEKDGNTLNIYLKGWTVSHGDMKVLLPYNPDLKSVELSGASDFHSDSALTGPEVEIEASGASNFYGIVNADELELNLSGASDATIEGQVAKLDMHISGSSDLKQKIVDRHYSLVCDQCECSISGSSDAFIHCDGTIRGSVSGSSRLHFTGTAFTGDCSTSGSSSIKHDVF